VNYMWFKKIQNKKGDTNIPFSSALSLKRQLA
jgi:hypothetical protein